MSLIRLYLDEDVRPLLAEILRGRGYDVVSALEVKHIALPDSDHFRFARENGRALLTFNICDFVPLASEALRRGESFPGLIVSDQLPLGELLHRTLRLLGSRQAEDIINTILWLSDYRSG